MFFHLFVSSSVSFISVLQFSVYKFFSFLDNFFLGILFFFDAIVNGIVFLISLSDSSFFKNLFILFLFLAVLYLRCCAQAFL